MAGCATCAAPNQAELEAIGLEALEERTSWREAARRAGFSHHAGFKNHMEKHYVQAAVRVAQDEFEALIAEAEYELLQQFHGTADASAKALYLVALQNLRGLRETKPSQQHLVNALKTIAELTGMKAEQKLMLQFSKSFFKQAPAPPKAIDIPDAEVVEE